MRTEELELVCVEAARNLVAREGRPVPATVVLPLPAATRVTTLPDFPDDDAGRFDLLTRFAADVMLPANAPCYGFIAEATVASDDGDVPVVVVALGARKRPPRVTAAVLATDGVGEFGESEEMDPAALPFLAPLQHAVDVARPPDDPAMPF